MSQMVKFHDIFKNSLTWKINLFLSDFSLTRGNPVVVTFGAQVRICSHQAIAIN